MCNLKASLKPFKNLSKKVLKKFKKNKNNKRPCSTALDDTSSDEWPLLLLLSFHQQNKQGKEGKVAKSVYLASVDSSLISRNK